MRATAKALLTGIRGRLRSSIGDRHLVPPNHERLSGVVRIRVDRIFPGEVAIAGEVSGNLVLPSAVGAKVLLEDHRGVAVKRGNKAAAVLQAVKA